MNSRIAIVLMCLSVALASASVLTASPALVKHTAWEQADQIVSRIVVPTFPARDFSVTDFGAQDGAEVLCTEAFRRAIFACHRAGGGRVVVPRGRYLVGAIHLKSNVNLHVSMGAVLLFSRAPKHYLPVVFTRWEGVECMNYSALIFLRNITVGEVGDAIFRVNFLYEEGDAGPFTPIVRHVRISNITAEKSKYGLYLVGYAHSPVQDVHLENCQFKRLDRGNKIEHAQEISFKNVTMNSRPINTVEQANSLLN
jgi:polygalacturonase